MSSSRLAYLAYTVFDVCWGLTDMFFDTLGARSKSRFGNLVILDLQS